MNFEFSLHPEKYAKIILLLYLTVFTMASVLAEWGKLIQLHIFKTVITKFLFLNQVPN